MTRVTAAQISLTAGDVVANRRAGIAAIALAADDGAGLVVLPELSDTGYVLADREEAWAVAGPGADRRGLGCCGP